MRFAYIDSQGKEVGIPTVEALQLRIELGAITAETIFYDASKDRWDPAGEHEIFRTLAREIRERGEEGPRPPTPRVVSSDGPEAERRGAGGESEGADALPRTPDPFGREQDPFIESAVPGEVDWVEVELEEFGEPVDGDDARPVDGGGDWDVDLGDFAGLDLAEDLDNAATAGTAALGPAAPPDDEDPADVEGPDGSEPVVEDLTGGLELERGSTADAGESSVVHDPAMELEKPLSELGPGPAGGWEEPEESGEPEPDFSGATKVEVENGPAPARAEPNGAEGDAERTPPRDEVRREADPAAAALRPRPRRRDPYDRRVQRPREDRGGRRRGRPLPRRRGGPSPGVIAAAAVLVAVMAAGAWFGWPALTGSDAPEVASTAALPGLPDGLDPVMRQLADSAWNDTLDTLRAMTTDPELPAEPNPDWLAGVYLANAGSYPDVDAYWQSIRGYLDRVRATDENLFLAAFRARLDRSDVPAASRDTVLARARAGFRAAAPDRRVVYDQLETLSSAATELHEFLVGNEARIAYEPAAGLSRDPVTEAIPSSQALGDEMWKRVGEIPAALEALGTLDRVTTERILDVFLRRLASVGIR